MSESNLSASDVLNKIQYTVNNADTTIATYLLSWLNNRYFFALNSSEKWPFLQKEDRTTLAFTDASAEATLPADFKLSVLVYDETNNRELTRAPLWQIRKNDPDLSETADVPTNYYYPDEEGPGQTLGIYPKLSSGSTITLSVLYQIELTPLTDASDSYPLIPNRHRSNILENGVVADYYRWKGQYERATHYEMLFRQALDLMKVEQGVTKGSQDEDLHWRWDDYLDDNELGLI